MTSYRREIVNTSYLGVNCAITLSAASRGYVLEQHHKPAQNPISIIGNDVVNLGIEGVQPCCHPATSNYSTPVEEVPFLRARLMLSLVD